MRKSRTRSRPTSRLSSRVISLSDEVSRGAAKESLRSVDSIVLRSGFSSRIRASRIAVATTIEAITKTVESESVNALMNPSRIGAGSSASPAGSKPAVLI